jgi:hypothetical protein
MAEVIAKSKEHKVRLSTVYDHHLTSFYLVTQTNGEGQRGEHSSEA